jgi:hypothetical protein
MVRSMLNSHPDLAVPHETLFLVDAYRQRRSWGDMADPENRRRLAEWVVTRERGRAGRLARNRKRLVERMVDAEPTLGSVLAAPFAFYAERRGKERWGDKRPSHVQNLDALFAMFPDAQYVHIVRDPRAAVASIMKINELRPGWFSKNPLIAGTDVWQRAQRNAHRWRGRLAADQFHEVQYEDLVADPAGTLGSLVEFLGLDPSGIEHMLAFHERADIKAPKMHPLVAQPVTTDTVRKWQQQLKPRQIAFIEHTLRREMADHGYEPVAEGVAVPKRLDEAFRRRRRRVRRNLRQRWLYEQWRRATYRHPVAAVEPSRTAPGASAPGARAAV